MHFIQRIEARLDELKLSPSTADARLNLPPDTIRNVLRAGKNEKRFNAGPTLSKAQQICDALGLELYVGPRRPQPGPRGFAEAAAEMVRPTINGQPEALHEGYLPIPWHRADLRHRDLSQLALASAWITGQELDPDNLFAISMPDDAMAPQIQPDEVLLLDTTFTPEPSPTLCAVSEAGRLRVGWVILPRAGAWVQFYARPFTPPLVHQAKKGAVAEFLGRIVGRFDTRPAPRLSIEESHRLHEVADGLLKGR